MGQEERIDNDIDRLVEEAEELGYECSEGGYFEGGETFCSYPGEERGFALNKQFK